MLNWSKPERGQEELPFWGGGGRRLQLECVEKNNFKKLGLDLTSLNERWYSEDKKTNSIDLGKTLCAQSTEGEMV